MSYAEFKESELARALAPVLTDPNTIKQMEALSRAGRPAVEAIGDRVVELAPNIDNTTKQHLGRLVRDTLAPHGWAPCRKARVRSGRAFSWGAVYAPAGMVDKLKPASTDPSGPARMEAIRKMIEAAGVTLPSADEFIAERRASWGE